jgi:hypothetical protein
LISRAPISKITHEDQTVPDVVQMAEDAETLQNCDNLGDMPLLMTSVPLREDILDIVNKQKLSRKRRINSQVDISTRIGSPKQSRLDIEDVDDASYNNAAIKPQNCNDISPFVSNANEPKIVDYGCAKTVPLPRPELFNVTVEDGVFAPAQSSLDPSVSAPIIRESKMMNNKRKLIMDKTIKISENTIRKNMEIYQEKFTIESPIATFTMQLFHIKHTEETYWKTPASRMKLGARKILPVFERNLKKIPINLLKRPQIVVLADPSPAKKRKLRNGPPRAVDEVLPVPEMENLNTSMVQLDNLIDFASPEISPILPEKISRKRSEMHKKIGTVEAEYRER